MSAGNVEGVTSDQVAASGWFPDPLGRFEYRFWNGRDWTADVSVNGQRYVDPYDTGAGPGIRPTVPARGGRGWAVAALVCGIVGVVTAWMPFLVVIGAAAAIMAMIGGVLGIRAAKHNGGHGHGFAIAGLLLGVASAFLCIVGVWLTNVVLDEVRAFAEPGRHTLTTDEPCTAAPDGLVIYEGSITNDEDTRRSYTITVEFRSGDETETQTVTVNDVAPSDTEQWRAVSFERGDNLTCNVVDVRGPQPFGIVDE
jgi:Protein of unknown function (DUF2510)